MKNITSSTKLTTHRTDLTLQMEAEGIDWEAINNCLPYDHSEESKEKRK